MDNATAREFVNYSASLIILANQMMDRMSVTEFLDVYSGDGRGQRKRLFTLMVDMGLVAVDDWYPNGEPRITRWARRNGPSQ